MGRREEVWVVELLAGCLRARGGGQLQPVAVAGREPCRTPDASTAAHWPTSHACPPAAEERGRLGRVVAGLGGERAVTGSGAEERERSGEGRGEGRREEREEDEAYRWASHVS